MNHRSDTPCDCSLCAQARDIVAPAMLRYARGRRLIKRGSLGLEIGLVAAVINLIVAANLAVSLTAAGISAIAFALGVRGQQLCTRAVRDIKSAGWKVAGL